MVILVLLLAGLAAVLGALLWRAVHEEQRRSAARVASLGDAIDGAAAADPTFASPASGALFRSADTDGSGAPATVLVAVAMALLLVVFVALYAGGTNTAATATPAVAHTSRAPLELLSMRHATDKGRLTITGLVRNPIGAPPVSRVAAVVFFFDPQGSLITSARAPLDFATLTPGDEAPFTVSVSNHGAAIGRYRVTFRTDDGVVRHVDKRPAQTLARQEAP